MGPLIGILTASKDYLLAQDFNKITLSELVLESVLTLILSISFCPENVVCFFLLLHYIKVHSSLDFIIEANTINPNQTATLTAA